ncbi:hypothetical protein [Nocardia sp. NPDC048505]|uniref:hypothetical protein n=1 Tax=unclassified Nocardia TaxID=2637762 RepID=UPI0033F26567
MTDNDAVPADDTRTEHPPRSRRSRALLATAITLAVAGPAAGVYFGWQNHHARELEQARGAAREAACAYGALLANYASTDLDSYFSAVLAGATGEWKKEFEASSTDLREVLAQGQVRSTSGDVHCAIATSGAADAEAIVVIDQSVASVGTQSQPRRGQLSITLSLTKSGDRWLAGKVSSPLLRTS